MARDAYARLRWRECRRKKRYSSATTVERIIRTRARIGVTLYAYLCPHCGRYHLTRHPNPPRP